MIQAAKCDITPEIWGLVHCNRPLGRAPTMDLLGRARAGDLFLLVRNSDVETAVGNAGHGVALTDQCNANQQRTAAN